MKTLLHIVVYIFILMGLSGCNSDVFVEDFQPSVSDVTLEGNGDSVTIRFKSSNWDLLRVYDYYDNSSLYYSVYDKDGNIVSQNQSPVLEGLGKIVCDDIIYKDLEHEVDKKLLMRAMTTLTEREKMIIELRFGINQKEGEEKTQKEVADLLGISQSYISRLEKKIIKRLKKEMIKMGCV